MTIRISPDNSPARCRNAFLTFWVIVAVVAVVTSSKALGAATPDRTYQVVILNSYHQGFQWTDDIVDAVVSTLKSSLPKVEFYIEYMDSKRCLDSELKEAMFRVLKVKYRDLLPDIVITSDDYALDFMELYHERLFPGVPVIFCGVNEVRRALAVDRRYFTGLVESLDIPANIALMSRLLPNLKEIVVLSDGSATGIGTRQMVVAAALEYPGLTFTYLNGEDLTTDRMLADLRSLKPTAAVIAPAWYQDKAGHTYDNKTIYPLIAKASPVPVFVTSSANIGLGVVGGKVNSGTTQGRYAAEQALRILAENVKVDALTVETTSQNRYVFDDRQLLRFSIDESLLPPDSEVLYRPFSFYHTYKRLVLAVFGVFCIFLLLIVFLVVSVRRLHAIRNTLARSEERLRVTLHSIGDAVITTDTRGYITGLNPIAETLTGWPESEAFGKRLEEVFRIVDPASKAPRANSVAAVLAQGTIANLAEDTMLVSRDSKEYRIADSCASIKNDAGEIIGAVLVFRDITGEYIRDAQLMQAQKLGAVGRLAGGVAHDFNNMLSVIMGHAEMAMMSCPQSDPIYDDLKTILESVGRSADLVRQLLAFARKQTIAPKILDLNVTVTDTLKMLKRLIGEDVDLVWNPGGEEMKVRLDPSQIDQMLANLCVNARDAIDGLGVISIETRKVKFDGASDPAGKPNVSGEYVMLAVSDNGRGMDNKTLENIFEPFYTTKDLGKGTGLGLATVYGIVKQNNGFINVYSEPGNGTTFRIYLPAQKAQADAFSEDLQEDLPEGQGEMVLLVEDEKAILNVCSAMLTDLGYRVVASSSPGEALRLAKNHHDEIRLLLTDVVMPEMNGYDLSKALFRLIPDLKCLFSSGYTADIIAHRGVLEEGVNFIQKPYSKRELAIKVRV